MSLESLDVSTLIRKRGSVKSKLTTFKTFLTPVVESFNKKETIPEKIFAELELRAEKVEGIYSEFEVIQDQIELKCEDKDLNAQYAERAEFENSFSSTWASVTVIRAKSSISKKFCLEYSEVGSEQGDQSSEVSETVEIEHSDSKSLMNIKLPTIDLPKFKGNHINWLEFKDTFESLIHLNVSINSIQKYHYLKASLEGEALKVIQSLEFSSENYKVAWELLCKRFDNSCLLVHSHVKSIFEIHCLNRESANGLRDLIDTIFKHLRALESLKQPVKSWDTLIIYILSTKLDKSTAREWKRYKISKTVPTLEDMQNFLSSRADWFETLEINQTSNKEQPKERNNSSYNHRSAGKQSQMSLISYSPSCYNCKKAHKIYSCQEFLKLSGKDRLARVKELKLCENCLCLGHDLSQCRGKSCQKCQFKHNTLLHDDRQVLPQVSMSCYNSQLHVLLSTAIIKVQDSKGNEHNVKALLDSGSQSCLITRKLVDFLNLESVSANINIIGINNGISSIKYKSNVKIGSHFDDTFSETLTCLVTPKITDNLPTISFDVSKWNIPCDVNLADTSFNISSEIHILIGASHFWEFLRSNRISQGNNMPMLQDTVFGHIVSGIIDSPVERSHCHFSRNQIADVDDSLKKFWELEEIHALDNKSLSSEDTDCENNFVDTFSRSEDGRFIVHIPLRYPSSYLGDSKKPAVKRFLKMEHRLQQDSLLRENYIKFMQEYEDLGHMSPSTEEKSDSYFLPHHCVIREDSLTTKMRIVFDGSAVSSTGWSLNDIQCTGPPILNDILTILLRFRQHNFVVCADVTKMYRQVLVHKNDRHLQQIIWRDNLNKDVSCFTLNTVTYGTKSAPYLAMRCLKQLSIEFQDQHPVASRTIQSDFYVDDLITGAQTEQEAINISKDVDSILKSAGFILRKWNSNSKVILDTLQDNNDPMSTINLGDNESIKTLGLKWNTSSDTLTFDVGNMPQRPDISKRSILSDVAKLFDPLGLVSPCILFAKILIQELWTLRLGWDEPIPNELEKRWLQFRDQLQLLNKLKIERHAVLPKGNLLELHGFCDASMLAYGACIYLRSMDNNGEIKVHLLCSKTKVAPLKSLTIPRLELCSAQMLARLTRKVLDSLTFEVKCYLWSDSQIVSC